ncbi:hypothetical protein SAMN05444162_3098 [Paenibacillaceae bacterium GAS479]|nr:hypothetical protein SAMN05444162_3098 [Paenibacillaceae bacterium GAS479]
MDDGWSRQLFELARREPFRRKIVLAERFQQGEQWLARATAECGPMLGMEVETLRSAVTKLVMPALAASGGRLLGNGETFWIVQRLMFVMAEEEADAYVSRELLSRGIVQVFHDAIAELRMAGIPSSELQPDSFVDARKGRYVQGLLARYEQALREGGMSDFARLLELLPELEGRGSAELYIVPSLDALTPVERRMLEHVAGGSVIVLRSGEAFPATAAGIGADGLEMFRAAGKLAEAREALRRLIGAEIPLDRAELIVPPDSGYEGAVQSLCAALGIPATYSAGRSVSHARAGRAARAYLDWAGNGYEAESLLKALRHGSITFQAWSEELSSGELIRALEGSGVGWGRERYALLAKASDALDAAELPAGEARLGVAEGNPLGSTITVEIAPADGGDVTAGIEEIAGVVAGERGDIATRAVESGDEPLNPRRVLAAVFRDLFAELPDPRLESWTPLTVLRGLNAFLAACAPPTCEEDIAVLAQLKQRQTSLEGMELPAVPEVQALRYVSDMVLGIRVGSSGPQSGKLHVSTLQDGGETGRPHVFVLGMSDSFWSASIRQDPVLLDAERARIGGLPLSSELAERRQRERALRFGRIDGRLTLSYCCYDPAEQKETAPAYELLQVARIWSDQSELDLAGLEGLLGQPTGYEVSIPNAEAGVAMPSTPSTSKP